MQNKKENEKWFNRKRGAMLVLTLCLVGCAAATTFYAMDSVEKAREEEQQIPDLNAEVESEKATEMEAEDASSTSVKAKQQYQLDQKYGTLGTEALQNTPETASTDTAAGKTAGITEAETETEATASANTQTVEALNFSDIDTLQWPVAGNVLMDYSMNGTVYFATLDQYKYNPALILGAEEGAPVVAAAKGIISSIDITEETGTTITTDLGNGYQLIYGQLQESPMAVGDVVEAGEVLGYISQPTKYYCEEGTNLYFAMEKDDQPEDPFLYIE